MTLVLWMCVCKKPYYRNREKYYQQSDVWYLLPNRVRKKGEQIMDETKIPQV